MNDSTLFSNQSAIQQQFHTLKPHIVLVRGDPIIDGLLIWIVTFSGYAYTVLDPEDLFGEAREGNLRFPCATIMLLDLDHYMMTVGKSTTLPLSMQLYHLAHPFPSVMIPLVLRTTQKGRYDQLVEIDGVTSVMSMPFHQSQLVANIDDALRCAWIHISTLPFSLETCMGRQQEDTSSYFQPGTLSRVEHSKHEMSCEKSTLFRPPEKRETTMTDEDTSEGRSLTVRVSRLSMQQRQLLEAHGCHYEDWQEPGTLTFPIGTRREPIPKQAGLHLVTTYRTILPDGFILTETALSACQSVLFVQPIEHRARKTPGLPARPPRLARFFQAFNHHPDE